MDGWRDFKKRHQIKKRKRAGETTSVNLQEMEEGLIQLRPSLQPYSLDDTFNMDESGLFGKMNPDSTLASEPLHGPKPELLPLFAAMLLGQKSFLLGLLVKRKSLVVLGPKTSKFRTFPWYGGAMQRGG